MRAGFLDRFCTPLFAFYILYVVYAAAPFVLIVQNLLWSPYATVVQLAIGPTFRLYALLTRSAAPIRYMAFPPTVPEWTELTEPDQDAVRWPKKEVAEAGHADTLTFLDA
jgi:hypothetical protein